MVIFYLFYVFWYTQSARTYTDITLRNSFFIHEVSIAESAYLSRALDITSLSEKLMCLDGFANQLGLWFGHCLVCLTNIKDKYTSPCKIIIQTMKSINPVKSGEQNIAKLFKSKQRYKDDVLSINNPSGAPDINSLVEVQFLPNLSVSKTLLCFGIVVWHEFVWLFFIYIIKAFNVSLINKTLNFLSLQCICAWQNLKILILLFAHFSCLYSYWGNVYDWFKYGLICFVLIWYLNCKY